VYVPDPVYLLIVYNPSIVSVHVNPPPDAQLAKAMLFEKNITTNSKAKVIKNIFINLLLNHIFLLSKFFIYFIY
jgi:hypothetical protein